MRTSVRLIVGSLMLAVATAACGSDSSTGTDTSAQVAGAYSLKSLAGVALPAPGRDGSGNVFGTVTSGTLTMVSGGSFTSTLNYTPTAGGANATKSDNGTYRVSGSNVTMSDVSGQDQGVATFTNGNTLTITLNAQVRVYQK